MILTQLTHFFQCKKITRHKLVSNVRDCVCCSPPPSSSSVKVFGDDICSPFLLEVMHGVDKKFIPKKGEACWQRSFYETGGQAFEESSEALLFGYLNHAVEQTSVAPHLHRTEGNASASNPERLIKYDETCCWGAYLSKVSSGCFKAPHLQSLLEQIEWVRDCFADHSSSTPTDQAF